VGPEFGDSAPGFGDGVSAGLRCWLVRRPRPAVELSGRNAANRPLRCWLDRHPRRGVEPPRAARQGLPLRLAELDRNRPPATVLTKIVSDHDRPWRQPH